MNNKYTISTLICVHTTKEMAIELLDYYTIKGEIVLLSCFNIIDFPVEEVKMYIDMDKEKLKRSDKLIVYGTINSSDHYAKALVECAESLGKSIQYSIDQ